MQAAFEALTGALPFIFLVSLRVGIVFASLPAPFGSVTPVRIRVVLTLFVSLALCAARQDGAPVIELEPVTLGRAALGELLVGAVIGLTVRVTLAAAEVAGNLAGTSMGQGFAASVDPTFGEQALPVGRLLGALMVLIFFAMDGHHVMLAALAWSLDASPWATRSVASAAPACSRWAPGCWPVGCRLRPPSWPPCSSFSSGWASSRGPRRACRCSR